MDAEEAAREFEKVREWYLVDALRRYNALLERVVLVKEHYEKAVLDDGYDVNYLNGLSKALALMRGTDRLDGTGEATGKDEADADHLGG